MWAVYLIGATDSFLHALFMDEQEAYKWGNENSGFCEGFYVKFWKTPEKIDKSDTGWQITP